MIFPKQISHKNKSTFFGGDIFPGNYTSTTTARAEGVADICLAGQVTQPSGTLHGVEIGVHNDCVERVQKSHRRRSILSSLDKIGVLSTKSIASWHCYTISLGKGVSSTLNAESRTDPFQSDDGLWLMLINEFIAV